MPDYFEFEVSLMHIEPRIWRRFRLHGSATFEDLHDAIQDSFGWECAHLWEFQTSGKRRRALYSDSADDLGIAEDGPRGLDAPPLAAYFRSGKGGHRSCVYTYDFGDDWQHKVSLIRKVERDDVFLRELLGGERAGPLEDCGGPWGYVQCVDLVAEGPPPDDPDLADRLEWIGDWDPDAYSFEDERRVFDIRFLETTPAVPASQPSPGFDIHASPLDEDGDPIEGLSRQYIDDLMSCFASSPEVGPLATTETFPDWAPTLVQFGFVYLGVTPVTMSPTDVEEIVFELFPAKFTCDVDEAPFIINELGAFFAFLEREYGLNQARACLDVLGGTAIDDLRSAFADPSRFGLAKQFFTAGQEAGFDMTDPDQANTFGLLHNLAAGAQRGPAPTAAIRPSKKTKQKKRRKRKQQKASRKRNR